MASSCQRIKKRVTIISMAGADQKNFRTGEAIFQEGEPAKSLYLILHGRVSIRKSTGDSAVEIAQVGPNQIVGEMAFFDRKPRSADAIAIVPTDVAEIPYTALDPIYNPAPDYLKKMMVSLATRLREADVTITELKEQLGIKIESSPKSANSERSEIERILEMTSDENPDDEES